MVRYCSFLNVKSFTMTQDIFRTYDVIDNKLPPPPMKVKLPIPVSLPCLPLQILNIYILQSSSNSKPNLFTPLSHDVLMLASSCRKSWYSSSTGTMFLSWIKSLRSTVRAFNSPIMMTLTFSLSVPNFDTSPVKRICVFEHSVMTNFNCACPAI